MKARTLSSERVYKGKIFELKRERIILDGAEFTRDIMVHPGSAVMVPVLDAKKGIIIMIRQYRHATGGMLVEFPAGTKDVGESYRQCAKRELTEETGYSAGRVAQALKFFLAPGTTTESMALFICSKLSMGRQKPEEDEKIGVFKTTLKKAVAMVCSGAIKDAKTIAGVMFLEHVYSDKKLYKKYLA
jgi:ADP-ribose pyrophosphatase